jgi:acetyltransferase-like isoleucine patch superfamily enzyme
MNTISSNAIIRENVIIGDDVTIEDNVFIDYGCIIRDHVHIGKGSRVGAMSILGEYLVDFYNDLKNKEHKLSIGENALIRSGTIIYGDTTIGNNFKTGHRVAIRENSIIGNNVSIGTYSDIQGYCRIGNYVNMHSYVIIGQESLIKDYVWLFPYVVLTNDPTPPSNKLIGSIIENFAIIATGSVLLPGVHIGEDALVSACSKVTKDVEPGSIVMGNPAKNVGSVTLIRNKFSGARVYPWRYTFSRGMPWENSDYDTWMKTQTKE